jgi:hypothetical protein
MHIDHDIHVQAIKVSRSRHLKQEQASILVAEVEECQTAFRQTLQRKALQDGREPCTYHAIVSDNQLLGAIVSP